MTAEPDTPDTPTMPRPRPRPPQPPRTALFCAARDYMARRLLPFQAGDKITGTAGSRRWMIHKIPTGWWEAWWQDVRIGVYSTAIEALDAIEWQDRDTELNPNPTNPHDHETANVARPDPQQTA